MDQITDAELVDQVRGGNKEAFGQLVERYQQMVEHIARKMVADEAPHFCCRYPDEAI